MRKAVLLFPLLLFTLGILFPFFKSCEIAPAMTTETPTQQTTEVVDNQNEYNPRIVKVGIYILNIGKLDMASGEFTADFYLYFSSNQTSERGGITNFEFCNGNYNRKDVYYPDDPTYDAYRIEAVLHNNMDLSRYPFDHHEITIELEDKYEDKKQMIYILNQKYPTRAPSLKIPGWEIESDDPDVIIYPYPWGEVSRFIYTLEIQRPVMAGFLKTILPVLIMVIVGLLSLQFSPDKYIARLTLITGSLTGAVILHLNITSSLPPLGYLTLGDRFMLFNYLALALSLISTLVLIYCGDKAKTIPLTKISRLSMIFIPILWIGLQLINFLVL